MKRFNKKSPFLEAPKIYILTKILIYAILYVVAEKGVLVCPKQPSTIRTIGGGRFLFPKGI